MADDGSLDSATRDAILEAIPRLRASAISFCRNVDRADDLVQDTLVRAISKIDSFEPGTNLMAWLYAILRNHYFSEFRKRRREVEDVDGSYTESLCAPAEQVGRIEHEELLNALSKLEPEQREAVTLVGASGLSYEEVSEICNCPIGTVKSRVHRARVHLAKLLSIEHFNDLNGDPLAAALSAQSSRKGGWSSEYPGRRG